MSRPSIETYPSHFHTYIKLVDEDDIRTALKNQRPGAEQFLQSITEEQSFHKYAPDKWSIKEVLQHIIDAERVFTYRAMAFARRDQNVLPSFDENSYADHSHADDRSWSSLVEEFLALRKATELLFNSFSEDDLNNYGNSNHKQITVLALGYTTVGHTAHHLNLIKERYL